jgi:hypothetical protein
MTPAAISADLTNAIHSGLNLFGQTDEARTMRRPRADGWCAREILGHLIDSACNNHRRFVIGRDTPPVVFQGYNQDDWVNRQRYADVPFRDLVELWSAYNRHLAHLIAVTPPEAFANSGAGPDGGDVTLGFLMNDYVTHLRHHLDQLREILASTR